MAYLVLVRHGLSTYNKQGLWAGWTDVPLVPEGVEEAKRAGEQLVDIRFDYAYTSLLTRAQQTLDKILKVIKQSPPITQNVAFNERDYGIYTGKNKWEVQKQLGNEEFQKLRRSWDYPIPNGESLKQVYERVLPYFQEYIFPQLRQGKNVIISASGNSLRALVKYLENIPDKKIGELEIGTGEVYAYGIDHDGKVVNKEIRATNPNTGKI